MDAQQVALLHERSGDFDAGAGSPMEVCAVRPWREKSGPRPNNQYRPPWGQHRIPSKDEPFRGKCYKCGRVGHLATYCRARVHVIEPHEGSNDISLNEVQINYSCWDSSLPVLELKLGTTLPSVLLLERLPSVARPAWSSTATSSKVRVRRAGIFSFSLRASRAILVEGTHDDTVCSSFARTSDIF